MSCGKTAVLYGYNKPTIAEGEISSVNFEEIRHPLIERIQTETNYITNDLNMEENRGVLLFGTNASGKSSLNEGNRYLSYFSSGWYVCSM